MQKPEANRVAWSLCTFLAGAMVVGVALLFVYVRSYWVARYRGEEADLRGAWLIDAPLRRANLSDANLQGARLWGADLRGADLEAARLGGADLTGANLSGARLAFSNVCRADLSHVDLRGADLQAVSLGGRRRSETDPNLSRALYDRHTLWPAGFDPQQHGAILIK